MKRLRAFVAAAVFVAGWRRLNDPATGSPHTALFAAIIADELAQQPHRRRFQLPAQRPRRILAGAPFLDGLQRGLTRQAVIARQGQQDATPAPVPAPAD